MAARNANASAAFYAGLLLFLFGAILPPMLWPDENQILVGFIGAPFVLFGIVLMLIGAFPTRRLEDKRDDNERGGKPR